MLRKLLVTATATAVALATGIAVADVKPEDAIRYRQGILMGLGWNVGPMGAMVKGEIPFDKEKFAFYAERAAALAPMFPEGFTPGSDKGETGAKPELWENRADFDQRAKDVAAATAKLAEVARGGDEGAMKAQFGETVKVCKGCHDEYREKE